MRKFKQVITMFAFIGLIALAACSGNDGTASNGEGSTNVIDFWTPFSGDDGPYMKEIVEEYNDSQDEYIINLQIEPNEDYYRNLDLAINDGKHTPDLLVMHNEQIISYVEKGLLREMDNFVDENLTEVYHENGIGGAIINEQVYGIPLDIHSMLLFWNKDMFEAAGLDPEVPPANREEFIEFAKQLTNPNDKEYGFVVPTLWPQEFIVPTLVAQNGGSLYKDGRANYTSDEVVDALQFELDLIEKHKVSPTDVQTDGELTLFLQGKNAMHLNGPWMLGQWEKSDLNLGVARVPQLGTENQSVFAKSHNFVVLESTDEEKDKGISDFLEYVSENSLAWGESGQAPASKATYESDEFKELNDQGHVMASQFDDAVFSPKVENWDMAVDPLRDAINSILLGQKDIDDALKEAEEEANKILEE